MQLPRRQNLSPATTILGWIGVLLMVLFTLWALPGTARAAQGISIPAVHAPTAPHGQHSALEVGFASESSEMVDALEAESDDEPASELPPWAPLACTRSQKLLVLSAAPTVLQRYAWPPIQVLQTRLELAFAARGPPLG